MQSGQPSKPTGWRITIEIPQGLETVGNLVGISADKEAYEELEAWEKHRASDGVGRAAATAGRAVQMAEMDAALERV